MMRSKVQVLVAAMNQTDHSLLESLKIQSDAIVANQCQTNSVEHFTWGEGDYNITYLNFNERGVGLNRNNALMRAEAEFCIFADDDIEYVDNYCQIIEQCFADYPKADVIVFNLIENFSSRYIIKKPHKIKWRNFMRYGAVRIAVKLESIRINGIFFNLCFGGGTKHGFGEDTLFLAECIKRGLHIIAVPIFIARLTDTRESTWFHGYNEKYFFDKGILFGQISKKYKKLLCLQDAIRHRKLYDVSWHRAYRLMLHK